MESRGNPHGRHAPQVSLCPFFRLTFMLRWRDCQATCTCWLLAIFSAVVVCGHGIMFYSLPTNSRCHMHPSNTREEPLQATRITPMKSMVEKRISFVCQADCI